MKGRLVQLFDGAFVKLLIQDSFDSLRYGFDNWDCDAVSELTIQMTICDYELVIVRKALESGPFAGRHFSYVFFVDGTTDIGGWRQIRLAGVFQ